MLLVVVRLMFLLVGAPNAPFLSTAVAYPQPSLEQMNGIASAKTSRLRSTSKDIVPHVSTLSTGTMLTTVSLETTSNRVALTIPPISTSRHLHPTSSSPETTARWIRSSTNQMTGIRESSTRSTPHAVISITPSATATSTPSVITRSIHHATTRSMPFTIPTRNGPTIANRKTTEDRRSTFVKPSTEVPRQRKDTKAGKTESMRESAQSLPSSTTYQVPTKTKSDEKTKLMTSMADLQTTVPLPKTEIHKAPPSLKPISLRSSTSIDTVQTDLSPRIESTFQSPATTFRTQSGSTTSVKTNLMINKPAMTSLPYPVPTVPLRSEVQEYEDMPQNDVGSIYHLPWIIPKTTSPGKEPDNVFHPALSTASPRRATKLLKGSRSRNSKQTTSPITLFPPLLEPYAQNLNYYKYGTTVPTSPVFNLLGNHSLVLTTSDPMRRASVITYTVPPFPSETKGGNKSTLPSVFPPESILLGNAKLPRVVPLRLVQTRDGNRSVVHPTFPSTGASPGSLKLPHVVPDFHVQTKDGNRSGLHPEFPPDNPKLPHGVPALPMQTRNGNEPALHLQFPSEGDRSKNPKLPRIVTTTRPVQTRNGNHLLLPSSSNLHQIVPSSSTSTETLPPEILPELTAMDSVIVNETQNCTNDYCVSDEDYMDMMLEYIFPTHYEWVLIGMHAIVFIGGLIGNALVCLAVYRNHSMRTVTNYFIVNLAVADFLVILLCLPPTVLWDVTETWFMGTALCKIVLYFQTVSVAVSVLTLTFISIDRWYAICCPLKFKSTTARAKTAIAVIWVLALAFDIPELVVLQTKRKELSIDTMFFTQCEPSWSDKTDMAFHCLQTILLYTLPLAFMSIAYFQIVKVLWSSDNIPGHKERLDSCGRNALSTSCRSDTIGNKKTIKRSISNSVSTGGQVICRRKAAKMLVAVVIMFAVCYFPVHLLSILRYTYDIPQTDATTACAMVSHWLCYANSAVNPVIYNFMSGKFRKEFANTFGCHGFSWRRTGLVRRRRRPRQTTVSPSGDCGVQPTEMAPLSRNGDANVVDMENLC